MPADPRHLPPHSETYGRPRVAGMGLDDGGLGVQQPTLPVPVMTLVPVMAAARSATLVRPDHGGGDLRHRGSQ